MSAGLFFNSQGLGISRALSARMTLPSDPRIFQGLAKDVALAWNLEGRLAGSHYFTRHFIMYNRKEQKAVIFLSSRTYEKTKAGSVDLRSQPADESDRTEL